MSSINSVLRQFYSQDFTSNTKMAQQVQDNDVTSQETILTENRANLTPLAEKNEKIAGLIAKSLAYTPDQLVVDVNDAPPLNDAAGWAKWNKKTTDFNAQAAGVTQTRIEMYNAMKRQGSSDSKIVNALVDLNKSLPIDYQIKSGLMSLNVSV